MSREDDFKEGWEEWMGATDPREAKARVKFYFTRAHRRIGLAFVALARQKILAKDYEPNRPLTLALKGSSTPLVDKGDLLGDITFEVKGHRQVIVGIGRSPKAGRRQLYQLLHDGGSFKITGKQARALIAKLDDLMEAGKFKGRSKRAQRDHKAWAESARKGFQRLASAGGGKWRIKRRPFITRPLESAEFAAVVDREYTEALLLTMMAPLKEFKARAARARADKAARGRRSSKAKKRRSAIRKQRKFFGRAQQRKKR